MRERTRKLNFAYVLFHVVYSSYVPNIWESKYSSKFSLNFRLSHAAAYLDCFATTLSLQSKKFKGLKCKGVRRKNERSVELRYICDFENLITRRR